MSSSHADEPAQVDHLGRQRLASPEGQELGGELGAPRDAGQRALQPLLGRRASRRHRLASSWRLPPMTCSRLLKSCATPPVRLPIASIFWARRSASWACARASAASLSAVTSRPTPSRWLLLGSGDRVQSIQRHDPSAVENRHSVRAGRPLSRASRRVALALARSSGWTSSRTDRRSNTARSWPSVRLHEGLTRTMRFSWLVIKRRSSLSSHRRSRSATASETRCSSVSFSTRSAASALVRSANSACAASKSLALSIAMAACAAMPVTSCSARSVKTLASGCPRKRPPTTLPAREVTGTAR